jgi:IS30 family transposase
MPTVYNHLNLEKRSQIYALRATKTSTAEIARILQCHPSTITREIKCNTGDRGYRYKQANVKAVERRLNSSFKFFINLINLFCVPGIRNN